jgi:hypothetical protein
VGCADVGPRGLKGRDRWARLGDLFGFFSFFLIPFLSFPFQTFTQNLFKKI